MEMIQFKPKIVKQLFTFILLYIGGQVYLVRLY